MYRTDWDCYITNKYFVKCLTAVRNNAYLKDMRCCMEELIFLESSRYNCVMGFSFLRLRLSKPKHVPNRVYIIKQVNK